MAEPVTELEDLARSANEAGVIGGADVTPAIPLAPYGLVRQSGVNAGD